MEINIILYIYKYRNEKQGCDIINEIRPIEEEL